MSSWQKNYLAHYLSSILIDPKTSQTNRENYLDVLIMVHHNHIIESRSGKISKIEEKEKITMKYMRIILLKLG